MDRSEKTGLWLIAAAVVTGLFISYFAFGQTTITVPAQSFSVTSPGQVINLRIVTTPTVPPPTPPPPAPPPTPPAVPTAWVYHNGAFVWPGDWSGSESSLNYADTVGLPGAKDIAFKAISAWAYWLPYPPTNPATGYPGFDTTPYKSLILSVKSTVAGQRYSLGAYSYQVNGSTFTGDISTGAGVADISTYCKPAISPGVWAQCTVPLTAIEAASLKTFYKFIFQDQSGLSGDVTYLTDVGFQ